MTNLKKVCFSGALILCFFGFTIMGFSQTISSHYFGENAWMPDTIGNTVYHGKLHTQWSNIQSSKASIIRFGGIAPDRDMPTNYQFIKMIDSVRSKGMEPVIQVPFNNYQYTAAQAATIVTYINVTKAKHIKYWIIGNEPNLGYSFTTALQIANYIKPFATAMKTVDPSILIIGPEVAWFDRAILGGLTTPNGPADITGRDGNGRFYVDIISFHTYPFNGTQTRAQVVSNLTASYQLQDNLVYLNAQLAACNAYHGRTGISALKSAITEANINWQNPTSDDVYGVGANSFIGGQFIAEMMALGLKNGVDFINLWSVIEGNSTASNIGFIDPSTNYKKPAYYHFQLLAQNLKGNFANGTTNNINVKSFGSKNSKGVCVMVLNEDQTNDLNFVLRLNSNTITATNPLKINIDAGVTKDYYDVIPNQTTWMLTFDLAGNLVKKCQYSLLANAVANIPPTCVEFGLPTATVRRPDSIMDSETGALAMNIFPNPSSGNFTIELQKENSAVSSFDIQILNSIGQQVYHKKSSFLNGREEIAAGNLAPGVYMVKVGDENGSVTKRLVFQN